MKTMQHETTITGGNPGPEGQVSYAVTCSCGWRYPGAVHTHEDAEIEAAEHIGGGRLPAHIPPAEPSAPLVRYDISEWDVLRAQSHTMAKSMMVPQAYKNNPDEIVAAALYGKEVGLGLMASLSYIQVINGKASLSAEGMVALVRSRGHSISGTMTATEAYVVGKRADTGDTMDVTWTKDMATRAGLMKNKTWEQYPEAMLWARAVSQLCRSLFPDVLLGLSYTPEEVADFTPTTPLRGREPAQESGSPGRASQSPAPATPDPEHADLVRTVGVLNRNLTPERRESMRHYATDELGVEPGRPLKEYDTKTLREIGTEITRRNTEGWPTTE